jgi:hypothetical protein
MKSKFCKFPAVFVLGVIVLFWNKAANASDLVVPAGTIVQCTLNEPNFSSATVEIGDPVVCHLRGMTEFGEQAFPRGSYLVGHLESAKDPGHFFGKGNLTLLFDRIGLPGGDVPLDAKIVSTRGYKVDKQGMIRGKGHAKRDTVEWMLPPLWPWKVIMLPARGPRPRLKGETTLSLRLMDDVQIPQATPTNGRASVQFLPQSFHDPAPGASVPALPNPKRLRCGETYGPEWHFFGRPRCESQCVSSATGVGPVVCNIPPTDQNVVEPAGASYAAYVSAPVPTPTTEAHSRDPLLVMKTGTVLSLGDYRYRNGRITYTLNGGSSVIESNQVDWAATTRVNAQRGIHLILHSGPAVSTAQAQN